MHATAGSCCLLVRTIMQNDNIKKQDMVKKDRGGKIWLVQMRMHRHAITEVAIYVYTAILVTIATNGIYILATDFHSSGSRLNSTLLVFGASCVRR